MERVGRGMFEEEGIHVCRLTIGILLIGFVAAGVVPPVRSAADLPRPRARDLGIEPGVFPPGPLNAITDVDGVRVGHVTVSHGENVRTGVTAILPHGGNRFQEKVAGAVFVGNAFGKLAGSTQVDELGTIEAPIVLTNTLSVGTAVEAVVAHTIRARGNESVRSVNALVGETNDGGLNDIRGQHVRREHVWQAIDTARGGAVVEGCVGAGTGTACFGWKGGIGTSSRILPVRFGSYRLGVLVQTNFGGVLTIAGAPVGKELGRSEFSPDVPRQKTAIGPGLAHDELSGGSCLIVVATDAPLDARDLKRLAARALFGLARTGSSFSNGSGDYAIAFTTSIDMRSRSDEARPIQRRILPTDAVSPLFQAALEATEEAVYNALLQAVTTTGSGRTLEAIPIDSVRTIIKRHALDRIFPRPAAAARLDAQSLSRMIARFAH
jgi:D-aminopeptidase